MTHILSIVLSYIRRQSVLRYHVSGHHISLYADRSCDTPVIARSSCLSTAQSYHTPQTQ